MVDKTYREVLDELVEKSKDEIEEYYDWAECVFEVVRDEVHRYDMDTINNINENTRPDSEWIHILGDDDLTNHNMVRRAMAARGLEIDVRERIADEEDIE